MTFDAAAGERILDRALKRAERDDYAGHSKYDALLSPLVRGLALGIPPLRWILTEAVMQSPVNIRPMLLVPKRRNPKGTALFVMALLSRWRRLRHEQDLAMARKLLDDLGRIGRDTPWGRGWGYHYPWQDLGFFQPPGSPNRVVTYYAGKAFLDAFAATREQKYLDEAIAASQFQILAPKTLYETSTERCVSYVPDEAMKMRIMDISSYAAALPALVHRVAPQPDWIPEIRRLAAFVVRCQTTDGGWHYTDPPEAHPKGIDNYHTAVILEALQHVHEVLPDAVTRDTLDRGYAFFDRHLFDPDDAPRWTVRKRYPIDIHSAASAVIAFNVAARLDPKWHTRAEKSASWMIENLWNEKTAHFMYQRTRYFTKRFLLMHWAQGWATRALAELLEGGTEVSRG